MTSLTNTTENSQFVALFRHSAPYIKAFSGRTFVLFISGAAITDPKFAHLVHDIALLNSLGIRLVIIHGARPQIDDKLATKNWKAKYINDLRITDNTTLQCVKEAVGSLTVDIEALLSMGLANSPMAGAKLRVVSGNFVTAQPYGIRDGVDYLHTGEVRRIDTEALASLVSDGTIVLLSPLGFSPTGEVFNLLAEDIAAATAIALAADKLIYLTDNSELQDEHDHNIHELSIDQARHLLEQSANLNTQSKRMLAHAIEACESGVQRVHLVNRHIDGAILQELFTRDGIGTLISADLYEGTRSASIEDVQGILELISPLEDEGILVKRSREYLETEIEQFFVVERDNAIIACAALYPINKSDAGELACFAVHGNYRNEGRGDAFLRFIESQAQARQLKQLIVLTTHTAHWFQERGFEQVERQSLPFDRQSMYNYKRNSKVFIKVLPENPSDQ